MIYSTCWSPIYTHRDKHHQSGLSPSWSQLINWGWWCFWHCSNGVLRQWMKPFSSDCSPCHHSTCCRELKTRMRTLPWRPVSSGWLWQNSQCARKCCADISPSKSTHRDVIIKRAHVHQTYSWTLRRQHWEQLIHGSLGSKLVRTLTPRG